MKINGQSYFGYMYGDFSRNLIDINGINNNEAIINHKSLTMRQMGGCNGETTGARVGKLTESEIAIINEMFSRSVTISGLTSSAKTTKNGG